MNVLVYTGPETLSSSISHAVTSIRSLVLPNYTVQTISPQSLATHPWQTSCALVVFPTCRNLWDAASFNAVRSYVERGGAFLALGTILSCRPRQGILGDHTAPKMDQGLRLKERISGSTLFARVAHDETSPPRSTNVELLDGKLAKVHVYHRDGFSGLQNVPNVQILGKSNNESTQGEPMGVTYEVGLGRISIWCASLEVPAGGLADVDHDNEDGGRVEALAITLRSLGLQLPVSSRSDLTREYPLPQFLVGQPSKNGIIAHILESLSGSSSPQNLQTFADVNDTFSFHTFSDSTAVFQRNRNAFAGIRDPSQWQPKHIIICPDGQAPSRDDTPLFDILKFFAELAEARQRHGVQQQGRWGIGEAFMYGEVVTSTQTLIDKNPRFMSLLPTPFVSMATHQLAGRGRGGNSWLSPAGCLQFSLLLRVSLATLPASKLVFVQYLFSLAVVEACRESHILGQWGSRVRLKWPNDLYAVVENDHGAEEKRKIGGVLVNTNFTGGTAEIVIGSGTNVLNTPPIFSLMQLLPPEGKSDLNMEKMAAAIMTQFEKMWNTFVSSKGSFAPFMALYLDRWLHSDQLVSLTTTTPPTSVRIVGITEDHGLLRTMPERTGWASGDEGFIDLQPDGNSFDLMAGLIKSKSVR